MNQANELFELAKAIAVAHTSNFRPPGYSPDENWSEFSDHMRNLFLKYAAAALSHLRLRARTCGEERPESPKVVQIAANSLVDYEGVHGPTEILHVLTNTGEVWTKYAGANSNSPWERAQLPWEGPAKPAEGKLPPRVIEEMEAKPGEWGSIALREGHTLPNLIQTLAGSVGALEFGKMFVAWRDAYVHAVLNEDPYPDWPNLRRND